jgi:hypothetical protein
METTRSSGLARRAKKRLDGLEVAVIVTPQPWSKHVGTRKHDLFRSPCPFKTKLLDRLNRTSMLSG